MHPHKRKSRSIFKKYRNRRNRRKRRLAAQALATQPFAIQRLAARLLALNSPIPGPSREAQAGSNDLEYLDDTLHTSPRSNTSSSPEWVPLLSLHLPSSFRSPESTPPREYSPPPPSYSPVLSTSPVERLPFSPDSVITLQIFLILFPLLRHLNGEHLS